MKEGLDFIQPNQQTAPEEVVAPPRISVAEQDPATHKSRERSLTALPDSGVRNPERMSVGERDLITVEASKRIIGNVDLEELVIKGIKGNTASFAQFTNKVSEICISLGDTDIDNIVRRFKDELRKKADVYTLKFNLSNSETMHLKNDVVVNGEHTERNIIGSVGIKSVAHFVRNRLKLHQLKPETIPSFYFENYLDATHKIDLIEAIHREDGVVLNLIQIKSKEYRAGEVEQIVKAHKDWVDGFAVDLDSYERNFSVEPSDSERVGAFIENITNIEEVFLEILTGDFQLTQEELFERLGIGKRPKVERVWILEKHLPTIFADIEKFKEEGVLDEQSYMEIRGILESVDEELQKVKDRKKDLRGVTEVHSLATVGEKVVKDEIIFKAEGGKRKAIRIEAAPRVN